MLKFGNTYLNFGGNYLTGWDYHKDPVLENGWSELYNINSYKELTSSNSADYFYIDSFGRNKAYIMSALDSGLPKVFTTHTDKYGNPLSEIIQTRGDNIQFSQHEDKVHIDDKDFTYLLYKFQVAPHSVGGQSYSTVASSIPAEQIHLHSNTYVGFYIGDKFLVENDYTPVSLESIQMMLPHNERFLCSSFSYWNRLVVDGDTSSCHSRSL